MTLTLNQRVAYSRNFLQSTGQLSGPAPFNRGTITEIYENQPYVVVQWDSGTSQLIDQNNLEPA